MKNSKEILRKKFSHDPNKYYKVRLFDELGFMRRKCPSCGKYFWTLNNEQKNCPDQPCTNFGFIGNPPVKSKLDYMQTWAEIEKFFVKNGHESISSYPTVCRWFPGLYFTIASIVAFQRSVGGEPVFEMPTNPLIIPQVCLRFPDIENVGVSGKHCTSFVMVGQHSIYEKTKTSTHGYWKDTCIDLDWKLLTEVFKIPKDEISFVEDVWVGPSAFGYSLEYFVRGLELGNAVFTEFVGSPENFRSMDKKVIDMGAGLERFAWILQGTPTVYDSIYGPAMKSLKTNVDYDAKLFSEYAKMAGILNVDDLKNIEEAKINIAKKIGVDYETLKKTVGPLQAIYAIADHAKTLLYGITDGQLPSNVGGGYNLRVVLRRALSFIDEFKLDIDLYDICEAHAKYLKKMDPRLMDGIQNLDDILKVERSRFVETRGKAMKIVWDVISKEKKITEEKMAEMYESNGITPELINEVAKAKKMEIVVPTDFYARLSQKHIQSRDKEKIIKLDISDVPETKKLFYDDPKKTEFEATVIKIDGDWIILDQTLFFAESGGQACDLGSINGKHVSDVQKFGNIIAHKIEGHGLKKGETVKGSIVPERRKQLMQHHTAVHVVNGIARKILGNHVWQAGALKTSQKAHLDITHYKALTEEEISKIESEANSIIKKAVGINKSVIPRAEAEKRYGFVIYQGGVVPEQDLRIIEVSGLDVEACGGIHVDNTKEIERIIIHSADRIQDGVVRITLLAGEAAKSHMDREEHIVEEISRILRVPKGRIVKETEKMFLEWKKLRKVVKEKSEEAASDTTEELQSKFVNNFLIEIINGADLEQLKHVSKQLSGEGKFLLLFGVRDNKISVFSSSGMKHADSGKIVSEVCRDLGGGGGGTPMLGQGVGNRADKLGDVINKIKHKFKIN